MLGELSKVVTPTRRELLSYTGVVLVFVVIMMAHRLGTRLRVRALVNFLFGDPAIVRLTDIIDGATAPSSSQ